MQTWVNQELNISLDNLYLKLNTKLDNLHEQNKKSKDKELQNMQLILHIKHAYRIECVWISYISSGIKICFREHVVLLDTLVDWLLLLLIYLYYIVLLYVA